MNAPNLVNRCSGRFLQWAGWVSGKCELPRLVRRLILETGRGVVQLGFPAGEGIRAGDWDGTLVRAPEAPYIPTWPLQCGRSVLISLPARKRTETSARRAGVRLTGPMRSVITRLRRRLLHPSRRVVHRPAHACRGTSGAASGRDLSRSGANYRDLVAGQESCATIDEGQGIPTPDPA